MAFCTIWKVIRGWCGEVHLYLISVFTNLVQTSNLCQKIDLSQKQHSSKPWRTILVTLKLSKLGFQHSKSSKGLMESTNQLDLKPISFDNKTICMACNVALCYMSRYVLQMKHDDVIKWKHFPRNWPFVRKIHRSPVNFPHKGQWRGALMFSLIYVWINDWANNREAGDLRRQHGHYDVIVMNAATLWYCFHNGIRNYGTDIQINGLLQDCSNSSALAMELLQSCSKPSKYYFILLFYTWALLVNFL